MTQTHNNILYSLFHTIFPRRCLLCNNILTENEHNICTRCQRLYPYPIDINLDDFFAPLSAYIQDICVFSYYTYAKKSILQFKFYENIHKGKALSRLLSQKLSTLPWIDDVDIIVPVPLHKKKLRQRGFNQCDVISKTIADNLNKTFLPNNLVRVINTKEQHKSNVDQRYENMRNAFSVLDPTLFENKTILLVDDVITTCSTMFECCKVLSKCNNIRIYVACLASDRISI
jgi:competence protein ComFC